MHKNTTINLGKARSINKAAQFESPASPSIPRSQRAQKTVSWTKGQSAQQLVGRQKALPASNNVQGGSAIGQSFGQRRAARLVVPPVVDRQDEINTWMREHERRLRMNALDVQGHDLINLHKMHCGFAKLAGASTASIGDPGNTLAEQQAIARSQAAMDSVHLCETALYETLTARPDDPLLHKQLQALNDALSVKMPGPTPTVGNIAHTAARWLKSLSMQCWSRSMQLDFGGLDLNENIDNLRAMLAEARHTIGGLHALSQKFDDLSHLGLTDEVAGLVLQLRDALKEMSAVLADHVDGPARQLQRFGFRELSTLVATRRQNTVQNPPAPTSHMAKPLPARHPDILESDPDAHRALEQLRTELGLLQAHAERKAADAQVDLNELKRLQADPEVQSIEKDATYRDSLYATRQAIALLQRKRLHDTAAAQRHNLIQQQGSENAQRWSPQARAELQRLDTFNWSFTQRELRGLAELEERLQNSVYQQAVERDARMLKKYERFLLLKQAHQDALQPDRRIERARRNLEDSMRKAYRSMGLQALKHELASYQQRSGIEQRLIQATMVNAYATHRPIDLEQEIADAERSSKQAIGAQVDALLHEIELMQRALVIARSRAMLPLQMGPAKDARQPDPITRPAIGEAGEPVHVFASALTAAERLLAPAQKNTGPSEAQKAPPTGADTP